MKKLFTNIEFKNTSTKDQLPLKCYNCGNTFYVTKRTIIVASDLKQRKQAKFCSINCSNEAQTKRQKLNCTNCNRIFEKKLKEIKKSKNHFCSRSCAGTYNNKHKTHGTRRSKLEVWLEDQLNDLYPILNIDFNKKDTIGSELDIYIPSMKLAFELNGIFHYEPIYGEDKLQQIQENDTNKFQACQKKEISLCSIDTSQQKYFKEKSSKKYLDIITTIINQRTLLNS